MIIPPGKCLCGCGGDTLPTKRSAPRLGLKKGEPQNYLKGHHNRRAKPLLTRLFERCIEDENGCWNWTGYVDPSWGYGQIGRGSRSDGVMCTHVAAYTVMVSDDIPDGYEVDHLCFNRVCCNPYHLEAVPGSVNRSRASIRRWSREQSAVL